MEEILLSIRDLRTHFFLDAGVVRAVDGVNLDIPRGRTTGLVGESGCGKSITAFSILRLIAPPGHIISGRITLRRGGRDLVLTDLPAEGPEIRAVRGKGVAMIFQEPMTSLSPVHRVGEQIAEAVELHTDLHGPAARGHAIHIMERVGVPGAARRYRQYPHEMSGGLRQRVMIAMALSCHPELLVADEPTTALDVTIQAQILELIRDVQCETGMSVLLITHDLAVVAEVADDVAVMYLGRIVEQAGVRQLFRTPLHPYTQALMRSIPAAHEQRGGMLRVIKGSLPDPFERIPGCPFHPRCEEAVAGLCDRGGPPPLLEVRPGRKAACLLRQREAEHG